MYYADSVKVESDDDEERRLMEAIENGETHPIPRDELEKIRREIMASPARDGKKSISG